MFESKNFTNAEQISLAQEIAVIGVQSTPLTSLLMAKGVKKHLALSIHGEKKLWIIQQIFRQLKVQKRLISKNQPAES
jgi:hypothetical protein